MENLLTYMLQVNLLLGMIYLGYVGLLKSLTFYALNRAYFLAGGLFAFIYPFLDLKSLFGQPGTAMGIVGEQLSFYLDEQVPQHQLSLRGLLELILILGALILLLRFIFQLLSLLRIHLNSTSDQWRTYFFRNVIIPIVPFSFLNKIYVNKNQHLDAELNDIFKHEDIHVKGLHSMDILLFEMILVCCWYNPFVWFMRRAIRQNLEFLTDQQVLNKGIDKQTYQYSLLNVSKTGTSIGLSNQFNFKLLKRRIMMMNKKRSSKIALGKYAFLLPVLLLSGAAFTVSKAEGSIEGVVDRANETTVINLDKHAQIDTSLPMEVIGEAHKLLKETLDGSTIKMDTSKITESKSGNFREVKRSAIDFSKDLKYFIDNEQVSKAAFLAFPEKDIAKYWFTSDHDLIKYKTKAAIDVSKGAILASTVEGQKRLDEERRKARYVIDGVMKEKGFDDTQLDSNSIASISVLKGSSAINKYGDAGRSGVIEVKTKNTAEKDDARMPSPTGKAIGMQIRGIPSNALFIINEKKADRNTIKNLTPEDVQEVVIMKDAAAVEKYGEDNLTTAHTVGEHLFSKNIATTGTPYKGVRSLRVAGKQADAQPLLVVNGKAHHGSLETAGLNALTIESMEILKNQNATALYGGAGKNGVMLVTTRKAVGAEVDGNPAETLDGKIKHTIKREIENEKQRSEALKADKK